MLQSLGYSQQQISRSYTMSSLYSEDGELPSMASIFVISDPSFRPVA